MGGGRAGRAPGGHLPGLTGDRPGEAPSPLLPDTAPCTLTHLTTNTLITAVYSRHLDQRARLSCHPQSYRAGAGAGAGAWSSPTTPATTCPGCALTGYCFCAFSDKDTSVPPRSQLLIQVSSPPSPAPPTPRRHTSSNGFPRRKLPSPLGAGPTCRPTPKPTGSRIPGAGSGHCPAPSTGPTPLSANSVPPPGERCWVRPKPCPPDTSWTGPSRAAPTAWKVRHIHGHQTGTTLLAPPAGVPFARQAGTRAEAGTGPLRHLARPVTATTAPTSPASQATCRALPTELPPLPPPARTGTSEETVLETPLPAVSPWLRTWPPTGPPWPPLTAVHSLAPLGEAVIENGPSDSISIQSPSEDRRWAGSGSGRTGGVQEGRNHPLLPCLSLEASCDSWAGGGERGESFAARLCCLQCPLGSKLGASQGPSCPGPETHLFPCLPAVPHLSPAGLHVTTPIPTSSSLPSPTRRSFERISLPIVPQFSSTQLADHCSHKATKEHDPRPRRVMSPQEHAAWGQTHKSPLSHPGVQTPSAPPPPAPTPSCSRPVGR